MTELKDAILKRRFFRSKTAFIAQKGFIKWFCFRFTLTFEKHLFKYGPPKASFCLLVLSNKQFCRKIIHISGIWAGIIGVEGEPADHLTSTTDQLSILVHHPDFGNEDALWYKDMKARICQSGTLLYFWNAKTIEMFYEDTNQISLTIVQFSTMGTMKS